MDFAPNIDAAVGEADFFANLGVNVPASRHEAGRDELGADVAFAKGFFVHAASSISCSVDILEITRAHYILQEPEAGRNLLCHFRSSLEGMA